TEPLSVRADHVDAGRRPELEELRRQRRIEHRLEELDACDLAEPVGQLDPAGHPAREADPHGAEVGAVERGLELHPVEPVEREAADDLEALAHRLVTRAQQSRARALRLVERRDGDLLEVAVVNPASVAVRDDQLLERRIVAPTEAVRALERHRAAGRLDQLVVRGPELLLEIRAQRSYRRDERLVRGAAVAVGRLGGGSVNEHEGGSARPEAGAINPPAAAAQALP